MSSEGTIATHFGDLVDERNNQGKRHLLLDVITIAICTIIAGGEGWTDMELFGQTKEGWFRGFLSLPHGIPSDDTFRRVFEKIDPKKFQQHFMDWVKAVEKLTRGQVIAIDGKTVKGTRHSKQKAIHIVSAWASENKVVLGQLKTDEKSNEITAIPQLLDLLSVSGCIVTIDAMGCQTEIAQKIIDEEGDYLLAVKKNQGHLYEDIEWLFKLTTDINYAEDGFDQAKTVDKRHGRLEVRQCWVITDSEWLTYVRDRHRWPQLCGVVKVAAKLWRQTHLGRTVRMGPFYQGIQQVEQGILLLAQTSLVNGLPKLNQVVNLLIGRVHRCVHKLYSFTIWRFVPVTSRLSFLIV